MTHAVDDDEILRAELAAAGARRWWNRWTLALGVLVLLLGGFVAGVQVQKAYGPEPAAAAGPGGNRPGGFPTAFPGRGAEPSAAATAQATTGTVKLVDGTTLYVQTEGGEVVTVRTSGETAVRTPSALKNLKPGDPVTVEGADDGSGTVTATSVTRTK
ncbi:DUF5666 domain-containing protein [Asanoa iriomotensis]|uniref:DUF5666 domain-containing protein n=1 Tax=Asanoa iriomotensis TaxID=234613 RepID=A0ABQ4BU54_9ACTN|nr:DUF5666 domain-containing protein [Asanoa iriomotensis]GIF54059.1 hypothetical protein Air01nite_01540 [Asanoa iriomotensis]